MISEDTKRLVENTFPDEFYYEYAAEVTVNAAKRKLKSFFVQFNEDAS